jgi:hypothetical protein
MAYFYESNRFGSRAGVRHIGLAFTPSTLFDVIARVPFGQHSSVERSIALLVESDESNSRKAL